MSKQMMQCALLCAITALIPIPTADAQEASGPPVFAAIFGARELDVPNPNDPQGNDYMVVLHDADDNAVYDDLEYDPGRGWGYEVLFPEIDNDDRFGPFDNSPNTRNKFEDIVPDELYDSFIGFKDFAEECSELTVGDFESTCVEGGLDADGGIFRIDVPNGQYRFVGVFGDADNHHAHRILVQDGGEGPPADGAGNHVVLVHNFDQAQYDIGLADGGNLGEGVFARIGFGDKLPPEPQGADIVPVFVDMDENGMPSETGVNSPVLTVTQGYLRVHLLQANSNPGDGGNRDPNGGDMVLFEVHPVSGDVVPVLLAGDADQDLDFDQLDLVKVQIAGRYLTGMAATWGDGDWNGAPGGSQGMPPAGDGVFDQVDVIAALSAGVYLTGPYAAIADNGVTGDGQTSISYNSATGTVAVDAPAGVELTSVNIDSAAGIFTAAPAENLGGSFDNDADNNIFKATFGGSFGSISLGAVAQTGLTRDFVLNDLTVVGSLAGGGDLGNVDLIYVPEPSAMLVALMGLMPLLFGVRRGR